MDKYYTPTIEEFHIGFECEYKFMYKGIEEQFQKEITGTETMEIAFDLYEHDKEEYVNTFRVKYLSQEDIESLGFIQIADDCFNLPIKEYRGRLNQEVRILIKQTVLIYLAMDMNYSDKDTLVLFTGNIKNKSELIKLLKQLGIG